MRLARRILLQRAHGVGGRIGASARRGRGTVRADLPVEFERLAAVAARLAEPGVADGTEQPLRVGARAAPWAGEMALDASEEGFLFEGLLVDLLERHARSEEEVEDDAGRPEDGDSKRGNDRSEAIGSACPKIAVGPEDHADPQGDEEGAEEGGQIKEQGLQGGKARLRHALS
jgi:hypothetical protein